MALIDELAAAKQARITVNTALSQTTASLVSWDRAGGYIANILIDGVSWKWFAAGYAVPAGNTFVTVTAAGGGVWVRGAPPAGTLPRYTGGTIGNVVVKVPGADAWTDATSAMQSQLEVRGTVGADNNVYPPGAAVPMPAGRYPADAKLMVKTASAAGQPNMEVVPSPYPANHDPSTTFTVLMTGQMSHDGLTLLSSTSDPIYLQPPAGELGEYDFLPGSNVALLPDLSGSGYPLAVADSAGLTYTSRGLSMSPTTTLTSQAASVPGSLSLIMAFRRANATQNHALYSAAGANGPLWQLGGTDQSVWGDVGAPSIITGVVNPTATANHIYGISVNGLNVTFYENGELVDTKTLTTPISSTGLIKLFAGNGNPFIGEAMYARVLSTALSATEHQTAYVRANAKISGRPA